MTVFATGFAAFDQTQTVTTYVVALTLVAAFELALACGILYLFYFLLTLPMRRNERARVFLDLLELGLKEGHTPEKAIINASASRDPAPGARFHLFAALLEKGLRFSDALARVPRLLPAQMAAMFQVGERIGDVAKVLPACRRLLNDGVSQVRGGLNYLLILTFLIVPSLMVIPTMMNVFVIPKFREVFAGMTYGGDLPAFTRFVFGHSAGSLWLQTGVVLFTWALVVAYVGGPRLRARARSVAPAVLDRLLYRLPWRRKRLQRDFSAMLAVLLDSGVPEMEAITLAADTTTNTAVQHRAREICARLAAGVKLPDAIRAIDDSGELEWRLANALRRGRGFLTALAGWHEALEARAFRAEQAAAQITTAALVLFNGAMVAGVVIAVFLALISLINQVALW